MTIKRSCTSKCECETSNLLRIFRHLIFCRHFSKKRPNSFVTLFSRWQNSHQYDIILVDFFTTFLSYLSGYFALVISGLLACYFGARFLVDGKIFWRLACGWLLVEGKGHPLRREFLTKKINIDFSTYQKFSKAQSLKIFAEPNRIFLSSPKSATLFVPCLCTIFTRLRLKTSDSRFPFGVLIFKKKSLLESSRSLPSNILSHTGGLTLANPDLGLYGRTISESM